MANIKSAKKRIKVLDKKTARNKRVNNRIKDLTKEFDLAIENNDVELAGEKLQALEVKVDQAAAKGTMHKNTASRKISRLTKRFNAVKAAQ
ncbi:MAG: 30S ribosomal protein S20 [Peptostreptococcaceae bacterium]|nr:30S ribosomal protein S20 [Peptostreptococcaceae bacterium]